jgi:hypothetical protein
MSAPRATAKQRHLGMMLRTPAAFQKAVHTTMKQASSNKITNECFRVPLGKMLIKVDSEISSFISVLSEHKPVIHNHDFIFLYLFNVIGDVLCMGIAGNDPVLMGDHVAKYMLLLREALEEFMPELFEEEMGGGHYKKHPFGKYVSERNTHAVSYQFFAIAMHVALSYANCLSFLPKSDVRDAPDRVACEIDISNTREMLGRMDAAKASESMALYLENQRKRSDSSIARESSENRREKAMRENERLMLEKAREMASRVHSGLRVTGTSKRRKSRTGGGGGGGGGATRSMRGRGAGGKRRRAQRSKRAKRRKPGMKRAQRKSRVARK